MITLSLKLFFSDFLRGKEGQGRVNIRKVTQKQGLKREGSDKERKKVTLGCAVMATFYKCSCVKKPINMNVKTLIWN